VGNWIGPPFIERKLMFKKNKTPSKHSKNEAENSDIRFSIDDN
jgi:hypothetical protein